MKIEFVSHAGFVVEADNKRIFIDPWTTSKAFNDGWALLSPAADVDYSDIDYIFVSHEHPDHFNPPTLKSIDERDRARITILYQKHASLRLKDAFERLGFKQVRELTIYAWQKLDNIDMYCGSAGSMDSFLVIRHDNQTILNLNDCVFREKQYRYIKRQVGHVDFMFTQFSFANWVGNYKDDTSACAKKISDIKLQRDIFEARYIVPFASFVYFCNRENSRMNDWINTPEAIAGMGLPEINFMYPRDLIDCASPEFQSGPAVDKYMNDLEDLQIDPTPTKKSFEEITAAIEKNLAEFKRRIKKPLRRGIKPFGIHIRDLEKSVLVDAKKGRWTETTKENTRYEMCSQVCWYTFQYSWGTGTLEVSGMYLDHDFESPRSKYFFYQNALSTEFLSVKSLRQAIRTLSYLWQKRWEILYRYL